MTLQGFGHEDLFPVGAVGGFLVDGVAMVRSGSEAEHDFIVPISEKIGVIDELSCFIFVQSFGEPDPNEFRLESLRSLLRDEEKVVLQIVFANSLQSECADPSGLW